MKRSVKFTTTGILEPREICKDPKAMNFVEPVEAGMSVETNANGQLQHFITHQSSNNDNFFFASSAHPDLF